MSCGGGVSQVRCLPLPSQPLYQSTGELTIAAVITTRWNKNSSGDETANVNFYPVRPDATRIHWNNAITPFKVTDFGTNRKLIYDFLLVINTTLPPILHRFRDIAVDRSEIAIRGYASCLTPPAEGFHWDQGRNHVFKVGGSILGLGYCTEQNTDGIPSFLHCSLQLRKKLRWSVQFFFFWGGVRTPSTP